MSAADVFTPSQRRALAEWGVLERQMALLEESLPVLRPFAQGNPPPEDVRDELEGFARRAEADVDAYESMLAGHLTAKVKAAARFAYYMERDPALGRSEFEPALHRDYRAVLLRDAQHARQKLWAARAAMEEVKGERQHVASIVPVALIHTALLRGQESGAPVIPVSYAPDAAFSRIVSVCMEAAGGAEGREHERAIRAYRASLRPRDEEA